MNSSAQNCKTRWQNDEEMQVITLKSGSLLRAKDLGSGSIPGASEELMRFLTSVVTAQYLLYTNALSCTKYFMCLSIVILSNF